MPFWTINKCTPIVVTVPTTEGKLVAKGDETELEGKQPPLMANYSIYSRVPGTKDKYHWLCCSRSKGRAILLNSNLNNHNGMERRETAVGQF